MDGDEDSGLEGVNAFYQAHIAASRNGVLAQTSPLSYGLPDLQPIAGLAGVASNMTLSDHVDPDSTMADDEDDDTDETDTPVPYGVYAASMRNQGSVKAYLASLDAEGIDYSVHAIDEWMEGEKQTNPVITSILDSFDSAHERLVFSNLLHSPFVASCLGAQDNEGLRAHLHEHAAQVRDLAAICQECEKCDDFKECLLTCKNEADQCQLRECLAEKVFDTAGAPMEGWWKDMKRGMWKTFRPKSYKKYQKKKQAGGEGKEEEGKEEPASARESLSLPRERALFDTYAQSPEFQAELRNGEEDHQELHETLAEVVQAESAPLEGWWKKFKGVQKSRKNNKKKKHRHHMHGAFLGDDFKGNDDQEGGINDQEWIETRRALVAAGRTPASQSSAELTRLARYMASAGSTEGGIPTDGLLHGIKQLWRRAKQAVVHSQEPATMFTGEDTKQAMRLDATLAQFIARINKDGALGDLGATTEEERNLHVYLEMHMDEKVAATNLLRNEQTFRSHVHDLAGSGFKIEVFDIARSGVSSSNGLPKQKLVTIEKGRGAVSGRQLDINLGLSRRVYVRPSFNSTPPDVAFASCVWFAQKKKPKNPEVFLFVFENEGTGTDQLLHWVAVWSNKNFAQRKPLSEMADFLNAAVMTEGTLATARQVLYALAGQTLSPEQTMEAKALSSFNLMLGGILTDLMPYASPGLASLSAGHSATLPDGALQQTDVGKGVAEQASRLKAALIQLSQTLDGPEDKDFLCAWLSDLQLGHMLETSSTSDHALSFLSQFLHATTALVSNFGDARHRVTRLWQSPTEGLANFH